MRTPSKELAEVWCDLGDFHLKHLAKHGVPALPPFKGNCKQLGLIIVFTNYGEPINKDEAGQWVAETAAAMSCKCAADIQSIRAYSRDYGWPIYSGDKGHLDGRGQPLERSCYCMVGTNPPINWLNKQTRHASPLACKTFEELCQFHGWRCVMCGHGGLSRSGTPTIRLEQGHMDPRRPLELSNTIPLCEDCNKFQLDSFVVDESGRVRTILPAESAKRFFRQLSDQERRQLAGLVQSL